MLDTRYDPLSSPLSGPVAAQQPPWDDAEQVQRVRKELVNRPGLVRARDVRMLRSALAEVAAGRAHVVQAGDCAEDPVESTVGHVARKAGLLDALAGVLAARTHGPVLRVGRIAGQFAKPRSNPTERIGDVELPVYRGHMVNSPDPDATSREPDPWRMLSGYDAAAEIMDHLGWRSPALRTQRKPPVWTSHEALLLDYETPMLRDDEEGRPLLASTHWPWIGERTRQLDGAHVALLADVVNPVACKAGPDMTAGELLALCERLDPGREPGRLTLIARVGAGKAAERLPALVAAVREAGHPVVWLTDPMHGNTVTTAEGRKTRFVETLMREVREFQQAVTEAGGVAGGLHVETTPADVTECVPLGETDARTIGDRYTSLCDPRLNPRQAAAVISAWRG